MGDGERELRGSRVLRLKPPRFSIVAGGNVIVEVERIKGMEMRY